MNLSKGVVAIFAITMVALLFWLIARDPPVPTEANAAGTVPAPTPVAMVDTGSEQPAPAPPASAVPTPHRVDATPSGDLEVRGRVACEGVGRGHLPLLLQWFRGVEAVGAPESAHPLATDELGDFVWRGVVRSAVSVVQVTAPAQPVVLWRNTEVVWPQERLVELTVAMVAVDIVLSGRVHDQRGAPIAGAQLGLGFSGRQPVRSDADGRYEIQVPPGDYPLYVSAAGFRSRVLEGYCIEGETRQRCDIELVPGVAVHGRVVDGDGAPVPAAEVSASVMLSTATTDAEGRFTLDGFGGGGEVLSATKAGFAPASAAVSAGGPPVELVLQKGLALGLRIVDADGRAVPGARVAAIRDRHHGLQTLGVSAVDGRFRLTDLGPAPVEVVIERRGYCQARQAIDPTTATGDVDIVLVAGRTVAGTVVDAGGRPLARVSLWCQRACTEVRVGRAATSSDGRFVLRDLPFGDLEIHAEHEAHRPFAMPLPATPEVVLTLQAAAAVAGRVVEAVSGAPVVEFTVGLWSPDGARPMEQEPIKTRSDDGTFLIRNRELEVGAELQVRVQADGHAEASVLAVAAAEPAVDAVVVRLNRGTRVHGVVVDQASGQPLAGVHVVIVERAEYLPARSLQGVVTLADGVFDAGVVVAGIWWLRLSHRERPSELFGPFEVGRGPGHLALRPTMSNGVVVRGRVTGLPGAAGLKIEAYRSGSHTVAATIGADLTFVLTGVGAGRTLLSIQDRERVRWLEIDVGTTDVDGVEFALRAGTGGLRVQVEGFERGRVRVERLTAGRPTGPADLVVLTAGTCVIDGLAAGRYRVVADADGNGRTGEVEVDVGTGEVAVTVRCQQ